MSNLSDIFTLVAKLQDQSDLVRLQPIEFDVIKLGEEYGEICADILKLNGYKVNKEKKEVIRANMYGEFADAIIMVIVLAHKSGLSQSELVANILEKLDVWEKRYIRPFDK